MFHTASLTEMYENWTNIGAAESILNWVIKGVPLLFVSEPGTFEIQNRHLAAHQLKFVSSEVHRLEKCQVIERCSVKPKCCPPISSVPKKGGKLCLIHDLRYLNKHCQVPKFNNEDIKVVEQYIQQNDLLATLDLQEGFYGKTAQSPTKSTMLDLGLIT